MTPATCRNCAAPLTGPYCAQCGQHAHDSARSLGALLHDAWHLITHVDSRFWSTLALLLVRPGQLTLEYFAERRARYVPPVRLYLVISIAFFGLTSLTSLFHSGVTTAVEDGQAHELAADLAEVRREALQAAAEARTDAAAAAKVTAERAAKAVPQQAGPAAPDHETGGFNFDLQDCDTVRVSPRWLEQPLKDACRRTVADHGKALKHAFLANIPKMMFVFLPLIACVMLLLYWFPPRYYVEHLVFVLHNHSALFLAMILLSLLGIFGRLMPALHPAVVFGGFALFGYAIWYVYRAMRRHYGQGRALTLAKLGLVGFGYLCFLTLTLLGTFVVSALIA